VSEENRIERLFEAAMKRLARRERSLSEIRTFLESRMRSEVGADEEDPEIDWVLRKLLSLRYIDDDRLAEALIRDCRLQSRGPRVAWMKLRRRGIEGWGIERVETTWRQASVSVFASQEDDENETARKWVERRYSKLKSPDPSELRKEKQRALAALVRRGYSVSVAKRVIENF
jgi:SOS response regulatory protein OraA/RecX